MADNMNEYESAGELSRFFCGWLCMLNNTKSCVGNLLVWNSLRITPIREYYLPENLNMRIDPTQFQPQVGLGNIPTF